ncbi:MAG: CSLREA domain-containing protein [Anaerolineae bacterium]|nr:CSLREA domain-containing protein [Anaerolineae bacterium]
MKHKRVSIVALILALALALLPSGRTAQAAVYTVNSTNDVDDGTCDGTHCSLREAINAANSGGIDDIRFNIPGCGGVCAIRPNSPLPALSGGGTHINGYYQPGAAEATGTTPAILLIEVDGTNAGTSAYGFTITSANNEIRGLVINRFSRSGVLISGSGATGNDISGNYIGTNAAGTTDLGNTWEGITIEGGAQDNTVGACGNDGDRNVISGNNRSGIRIEGSGTMSNIVCGSYIGANANGTGDLGNTQHGVRISGGTQNNTVGYIGVSSMRNVIAGNDQSGVYIHGSGTMSNTVDHSYIGLDKNGTTSLGNSRYGVHILSGAQSNTVGGDAAGEGNVISGNGWSGVTIEGSGTTGNIVSANYIGTNAAGTADRGNSENGVLIWLSAQSNTVGGDTEDERNIISGNNQHGILIESSGTMSNTVSHNSIGLTSSGADLGNTLDGVRIRTGAQNNAIGGTNSSPGTACLGECNYISGNDQDGVYIEGSGTSGNTVSGNYIGTTGSTDRGNADDGVYIGGGAQNNTIGGNTDGERNVISGNDRYGVWIEGNGTTGNTVSGNYIGTMANGTSDLGNTDDGIYISGGAQNNTIGGDVSALQNVISGNDQCGVFIEGSDTMSNTISANYIGADAGGVFYLGNTQHGVRLSGGAQNNMVGGDTDGERNVIAGNNLSGVYVHGSGTTGNTISANYIGLDKNGTADLGNSRHGVYIVSGAQNNTVGGDTAGEGNVISGNGWSGVDIEGVGTTGNIVSGNYIGTDRTSMADLGNTENGVLIGLSAQNNTIGGNTDDEQNVISGNDQHGVLISSSAMSNTVLGNHIGTDTTGTIDRGNTLDGVRISNGAQNNTIGGNTDDERNVISGNDQYGVYIEGSGTTGNTVSANYIGIAANGTNPLGNASDGVFIGSSAQNNTVGGNATGGERNVIAANAGDGVHIEGSGTTGNTVSANYIGTDASGTLERGNGYGVFIGGGAQNNTIGGDNADKRNVIADSSWSGVYIGGAGTTGNIISANYIGTDHTGTANLGNQYGVHICDTAQYNMVGGDSDGERNVISGNALDGVRVEGSDTMSNTVSGNYIGTDASGTVALGNTNYGVRIRDGAQYNTIGGDADGERNVIAGNDWSGVLIEDSGTTGNIISANYIGTDHTGTANLGNSQDGIDIVSGAQDNTIGGSTADERNVISGNDWSGILIHSSGTMNNTVSGNYIGTDTTGTADLGNADDGVTIAGGAQYNTIGGSTADERNVISGNDRHGVGIVDSGTTSNTVSGNHIGTNATGTTGLGNTQHGVLITYGAQNNTVGPGNIIAYNSQDGVEVNMVGTLGNAISQNSIFSNTMGIDLANQANGEIDAPVIVTTTVGSVNIIGTACANCTVEVFQNSDTDGEGETYVGGTTADGSGNFTVTVTSLAQPYLTATASDVISGTSEFSGVFSVTVPLAPPAGPVYLPIILRNTSN